MEQVVNRYYQRMENEMLKKMHEEQSKILCSVFNQVQKDRQENQKGGNNNEK